MRTTSVSEASTPADGEAKTVGPDPQLPSRTTDWKLLTRLVRLPRRPGRRSSLAVVEEVKFGDADAQGQYLGH